MSLVQELKQRSSWTNRVISIVIIIWLVFGGYYGFQRFATSSTTEETTTSSTATVKKTDITIWTESDWQIKWDSTLSLSFQTNWTIQSINKQIWDKVSKWEIIWILDSSDLQAEVRKATNSLNQAIANYNTKVKPLSTLEIQQINASLDINQVTYDTKVLSYEKDKTSTQKSLQDLETKRSNLVADLANVENWNDLQLKKAELDQQLIQKAKDLSVQIDDIYQKNKDRLRSIDDFMWFSLEKSNNNDSYEYLISAKNSVYKSQALSLWTNLQWVSAPNTSNLAWDDLLKALDQASNDAKKMRTLAQTMIDVMENTIASSTSLTDSQIATRKNTFTSMYNTSTSEYQQFEVGKESYKSTLLSSTNSFDTSTDSQSDKIRSYKDQIAQVDADITYQKQQVELKEKEISLSKVSNNQQLKKDNIDYQLKLNPLSSDEKNLYQLQLEAARISVLEKKLALAKATLRSPADGVILSIDWHPGETAASNFVSIATKWYTYIETALDQEDINKVKEWQIVTFIPEAFDNVSFTWEVYYIATEWTTDSNGIVTYKVLIKYSYDDARIKIGMKWTLTFVQKSVKNVLTLPVKAVVAYQNAPHVLLPDGTYRKVITGLSDWKQTEIISWLNEWDTVLLKK